MDWNQQYGCYCRNCEYWQAEEPPCHTTQRRMGKKGICHRFPPNRFCPESNLRTRPITLASDGCGEFKPICYIQSDKPTQTDLIKSTPTPHVIAQEPESLLLNVKQLALLLGVSQRHLYSMRDNGLLPPSQNLGRNVRWSRQEILDWIEAGCPPMNRWKHLRQDISQRPSK